MRNCSAASCKARMAVLWKRRSVLKSCATSLTTRWKDNSGIRRSTLFWNPPSGLHAGTDTQKLVSMLESMFGDGEDIEIEDLDSDDIQKLRAEADKAEEEAMRKQGRVSAFNKTIIVKSLPLAPEFGIDDDYWPELIPVREWDDKKKEKVHKLYYHCRISRKHESQNRASMLTHTRRCMKIFLVCGACDKSYLSVKGLADHVASVHEGILDSSKVSATSMQAE